MSRTTHARALLGCGALLSLPGCFLAHEREPVPIELPCDVAAPVCVRREHPCDALRRVEPECVDDTWTCPRGSDRYAPPWADDVCLPLAERFDLLPDGVNEGPVPVPLDGTCAWVLPSGAGGTSLVAVDVATSCAALGDPVPVATPGTGFDYLSVQASYVDAAGGVRVVSRGWAFDAAAPFGVRATGVGLGRARAGIIEAPTTWLFDERDDLGDAAVVDGGFVYAFGCPGTPRWLEEDCIVGRAPLGGEDDRAAWAIFGEDGWGAGAPVRVFGSGPHRGAVVRDPRGGFLHVYAIGFGTTVEAVTAPAPEGPWSAPSTLVRCELPADDPGAYCAGVVVNLELYDPLRPGELVVSYSIGTTSADGDARRRADPRAYWPRVVRVTR